MSTFGTLLRQYRKRSGLTLEKLADWLDQEPGGAGYSAATISNWEKGKYEIRQTRRDLLVSLLKTFYTHGGLKTLAEANQILTTGRYAPLSSVETQQISPTWLESATLIRTPSPFPPPFMTPPLPAQGIIGRATEIQQIFSLLRLDDETTTEIPPVTIRGLGGIGKTILAQAIGRSDEVATYCPDGVLWVALGPHPTLRPHLERWGRALGVDLRPEPDESACRERLQAVLYNRRVLLIVDDVWEVAHGRLFALAGPRGRILFTTRELPVAQGVTTRERTIRLDVLTPSAALQLLDHLVPEVSQQDKTTAQQLCERLEYLPLALTLAGRLLALEADFQTRLQTILHELLERRSARLSLVQMEGRPGLSLYDDEPISLQAILGMSVSRLNQVDQERFAMLSVFGGEPLTWELNAAAHVWQCSLAESEETSVHFVQRGLVERRQERYWMHALLADYAAALCEVWGL